MSDTQENTNMIDPSEALRLAEEAEKHVSKRTFGGEESPLPKFKDTIVALREKNYTFEMVSEFLKNQCGVSRGAGPQSVRNYLVEEGLYEPPTRNTKSKEDNSEDAPADTEATNTAGVY
jgi:hypothetical protein